MKSHIDVSWQMHDPPTAVKNWREWTAADFSSDPTTIVPQDILLDGLVEYILTKALEERLPRSTGWLCDTELNLKLKTALQVAASIYKRGVGFSAAQNPNPPKTLNGSYQVKVSDTNDGILDAVASDNFLIVDKNVFTNHKSLLAKRHDILVLQLDEHTKSLASVRHIMTTWNQSKKSKTWCIIGGGILTDTAAFAARLCQCESEFIPTTLLAMADACVGGKTGVNAGNFGKNLIGSFYFPRKVLVWPEWLVSLDQRQTNAGSFECLKHFFIRNDLAAARAFADSIVKKDIGAIASHLPTIIKVKADIVEQDPAEIGKRAILNFGHTLGHALEGISQKLTSGSNTILHGEAVGVGMMFAIFLSTKISGLPEIEASQRIDILKSVCKVCENGTLKGFLADKDPGDDEIICELQQFITQDKKATGNTKKSTQWIVLSSTGEVEESSPGEWTRSLDLSSLPALWTEFLKKYC